MPLPNSHMSCPPLKRIWTSRIAFISCLLASAVVLGCTSNYFLRAAEVELGRSQFAAIAERALAGAKDAILRRQSGAATVATLYSNLFPDAGQWPFVSIPRYNAIATEISFTSSGFSGENNDLGQGLGVAQIVKHDDVEEFNEFQEDYLNTYFPPARAVYQLPPVVLPDGSINPLPRSQYNITVPLSAIYGPQTGGNHAMLDLFSTPLYRPIIDRYLLNAEAASTSGEQDSEALKCGILSWPIITSEDLPESGPKSLYTHPIYPTNDPSTVVGMVVSPFHWNLVLWNLFSSKVSGLDCVVESLDGGIVHTFSIHNGKPSYKGAGDLHQKQEDGISALLTDGLCEDGSVAYRLTLYPTTTFFRTYTTLDPFKASIGAVLVIAFTSLLFFLYDCSVRKVMYDKQTIIQAKRSFLRFVSHEVRTPLNTVSMGLKVICEDVREMFQEEKGERKTSTGVDESGIPSSAEDGVWVGLSQANKLISLACQINDSAESAVEILSDVLSYDKIENGKLNLELTYFPCKDLLDRIVSEFMVPARAKNIKLTIDCREEDVSRTNVVADAVRLAQVARNLMSNSLKFTPEGGSVRIILRSTSEIEDLLEEGTMSNNPSLDTADIDQFGSCVLSGQLQVTISDNGVGMTKTQLATVFNQGVQFNANSLQGGKGSGLGLFIAKGIVEQHGGALTASSGGLGSGSTFTMTLPIYDIPTESPSLRVDVRQHPKGSSNSSFGKHAPIAGHITTESESETIADAPTRRSDQLTALVVDDVLMNRKLLSRLLEKRGWNCDCAEDGQVAVDMVRTSMENKTPYDCILLDYEMPVMNGPEAARQIRSMECPSFMIGVTGNVLPDDISHFISCGVVSVVFKPVNLHELDSLFRERGLLSNANVNSLESPSTRSPFRCAESSV